MVEMRDDKSGSVEVDMVRHLVIDTLRNIHMKFSKEYGELIIVCDSRKNWRQNAFEYYKASRKTTREKSAIDWESIYTAIDTLRKEIHEFLPYKVIQYPLAEADDVIAVLAKWSQTNDQMDILFDREPKPFLILSRDHDFVQLQKYPNVKQWSPIDKKWIKPERNAELDLLAKIIGGDVGDGIPNFLSDDDTFVTEGKKQKSIFQAKLAVWLTQRSEEFCTTPEMKKNFERNRKLIDFDYIPQDIQDGIINTFLNTPSKDRRKLMNYFVKNRMKNMMDKLGDF